MTDQNYTMRQWVTVPMKIEIEKVQRESVSHLHACREMSDIELMPVPETETETEMAVSSEEDDISDVGKENIDPKVNPENTVPCEQAAAVPPKVLRCLKRKMFAEDSYSDGVTGKRIRFR